MGKQDSSSNNDDIKEETKLVGALDSKDVIGINTIVEIKYKYQKCGHETNITKKADESMFGLGVVDFLERFDEFRIIEFSERKLELAKSLNQYCDKHYLLKMIGDTVMILQSDTENEDFVVVKKTKLRRKDLDDNIYLILKRGKLFNSLDDIENYINSIIIGWFYDIMASNKFSHYLEV